MWTLFCHVAQIVYQKPFAAAVAHTFSSSTSAAPAAPAAPLSRNPNFSKSNLYISNCYEWVKVKWILLLFQIAFDFEMYSRVSTFPSFLPLRFSLLFARARNNNPVDVCLCGSFSTRRNNIIISLTQPVVDDDLLFLSKKFVQPNVFNSLERRKSEKFACFLHYHKTFKFHVSQHWIRCCSLEWISCCSNNGCIYVCGVKKERDFLPLEFPPFASTSLSLSI